MNAFWGWLRLGKPLWWLFPGLLSLAVFACLLTLVEAAADGRAYDGVYKGVRPDRWDLAGAAVCLTGAAIILWGSRA